MSVYQLNRAIHHIYIERDRALAFRGGDNAVLDKFDLSAEERAAMVERDFPRLWALNAHPVLLFHLSVVLFPREWYMQNVVPKIQGVPNAWYDYYDANQPGIAGDA